MLTLNHAEQLVGASRKIVEKIIEDMETSQGQNESGLKIEKYIEKTGDEKLNEMHGVFITIKKFSDKSLRGCIGFISPSPLWESVQRASALAAFGDPRFPRLTKSELDNVVFEVSVMSEPSLVSGESLEDYKKNITIGRDGLIIINGSYSGLLLPQVAVEHNLSIDKFLESLCYKANLTLAFLQDENTKILKFQCQIFIEDEPNGKITEIKNF